MRTPLVRYKDFSRGEGPRELTRGRTPGPPERTTCVDPAKDFSFPWLRHLVITLVPRSLARSEQELPRCRLTLSWRKRSEERRVGKECVSWCRSGWSRLHK